MVTHTDRIIEDFANARQSSTRASEFNDNNRASAPHLEQNEDQIFCNKSQVAKILKALPNKTSTGLDGIPAIILKHLPPKII